MRTKKKEADGQTGVIKLERTGTGLIFSVYKDEAKSLNRQNQSETVGAAVIRIGERGEGENRRAGARPACLGVKIQN